MKIVQEEKEFELTDEHIISICNALLRDNLIIPRMLLISLQEITARREQAIIAKTVEEWLDKVLDAETVISATILNYKNKPEKLK